MSEPLTSDAQGSVVQALPPWLDANAHDALSRRSRWPHALLLSGPAGTGKRLLAWHLARALVCEAPRENGAACTQCASCRYAAAGQHPDLKVIEPVEIDDEGNATPTDAIKVDSIRALTAWAQVTSHRGGAKVALIMPAERMNASAANALLKTLEEPPAGTYMILASHQPARLAPTIASRCSRHIVSMPPAAVAIAWLRGQDAEDPPGLLAQAGGAPFIALSLADPAHQTERRAWLHALSGPGDLLPAALAARLELGGRDGRRERLGVAIDWLIAWTSDLARIGAGGQTTRNTDFARPLALLAPRVARLSLFRYYRQLLQQRALLTHPLQPRLVAEALLIDYRSLFN